MNCRPGDLAIIVGAKGPGLNGRIVEVERLAAGGQPHPEWAYIFAAYRAPVWLVKSTGSVFTIANRTPSMYYFLFDHILRPIRPDAERESTTTEDHLQCPTSA